MKFYEICFSPTGGTKKAADILSNELSSEIHPIDLTDSKQDFSDISLSDDDTAVIAVPSYGGRVPEPAVSRLASIIGNGAKAVLVCVYGNRAYEDTLIELSDTAKKSGFQVIAGIAAIAEHSIMHQYATGRPDDKDRKELQGFAEKILTKINGSPSDMSGPQIPGNHPYKKAGGAALVPKADHRCNACGLCAEKCPAQAINRDKPKETDG